MDTNSFVTLFQKPTQWYEPVQLAPSTLFRLSREPRILKKVLATLKRLTPDNYQQFVMSYYQKGLTRFGENWGYLDLLTILQAAAQILKPEAYLEIGVRRGRSMAIVARERSACHLFGFDLWVDGYAGMENPGPDFVRGEMKRVKHNGPLTLIFGDSKETIPKFLLESPNLFFDIITVDGDHSEEGAQKDLENVIPRLKVGGVLLLDDISHPQHRYLEGLWDRIITPNGHFWSGKYLELGYGIAFAIRRSF